MSSLNSEKKKETKKSVFMQCGGGYAESRERQRKEDTEMKKKRGEKKNTDKRKAIHLNYILYM
jgi:hypothetical protein